MGLNVIPPATAEGMITGIERVKNRKGGSNRVNARGSTRKNMFNIYEE